MDDTRREERADPSPPRPSHDTGLSSWVMVVFTGELDIGARSALNVLDEAVRAHPGAHVLVDLSDVTFMDSTALVAFAEARSRAAAGGGVLSLHGASAFAQRMLDIWHLEPVCSRTRQAGDVHAITTLRGHSVVPFPRPRASQTQHSDDRPSCVGDSRRS
nr:STAS domain-containing protein [uncultured Nocardioides sp.]